MAFDLAATRVNSIEQHKFGFADATDVDSLETIAVILAAPSRDQSSFASVSSDWDTECERSAVPDEQSCSHDSNDGFRAIALSPLLCGCYADLMR